MIGYRDHATGAADFFAIHLLSHLVTSPNLILDHGTCRGQRSARSIVNPTHPSKRNRRTSEQLPGRLIKSSAIVFSFWIAALIFTPYPDYIPPDFERGFLQNKENFFFASGYFLGFYPHIIGAPLALFSGGLQCSQTLRERYPGFHRWLGRVYVAAVMLLAAPGGLIMSVKAYGGWSSTVCFASIAIATWISTWLAWNAARNRQFEKHARWMRRSYLLILSAVFLRMFHYLLTPLSFSHQLTYQIAAWASWLFPIAALEIWHRNQDPVGPFVSQHSMDRDSRGDQDA